MQDRNHRNMRPHPMQRENNMDTVITIILAAGIPSAIFGLLIRRLEKKWDKAEAVRAEKEENRIKHETMMIDMIMASLSLAEATAEAVQRIPDANCNGDMTEALNFAKNTKQKYREFEREQVVKTVM